MNPLVILAEHINPRLIPIAYGGNATSFLMNGKRLVLTRKTTSLYARLPKWVKDVNVHALNGMYILKDSENAQHVKTDELLYDLSSDTPSYMKMLTHATGVEWGLEDPRAVNWDDTVYILMSRRDPYHTNRVYMFYSTLTSDYNLKNLTQLHGNLNIEKNWAPINGKPGMCIYTLNPLTFVNIFTNQFINTSTNSLPNLRGSSNIVEYGDGYIGVFHERTDQFQYIHYFVLFDHNLNVAKISQPFSFFGMNVEFNCHLEHNVHEHVCHIVVSIHEHLLYQFILGDDLVEKLLVSEVPTTQSYNFIPRLYMDALQTNDIPVSIALATYTTNKPIVSNALLKNHNTNFFIQRQQQYIECQLLDNFHAR